jgi:hypothetical protein
MRGVKHWQATLTMSAAMFASIALADDFKTINGKEYKNVTVSRVEPDGIMVASKSGILKLYFVELPKEVQERFNYNPEKAAVYSAEQNAALQQPRKQQQEAEAGQKEAIVRDQKEAGQKQAIVRDQNERAAKVEAAIANGEIFIGMTGEECVRAWGRPEKVNATETARGHHSQWAYPGGRYVYFENGIITTIQH